MFFMSERECVSHYNHYESSQYLDFSLSFIYPLCLSLVYRDDFKSVLIDFYFLYLSLYREDFKSVLHEVRRNNKNTLSGLSLDSITEQVKAILDSKDKGRGSSSSSSSSSSKGATGTGTGGSNSKGRQNKSRTTSSRQQQQV